MTREPARPRPLQPTRRVAGRAVRAPLLRQRQRASRLRPLPVSRLNDVGTASEAAYPPGYGDELLANGRTAQHVADAENQRDAEQSHGMPSVGRPLRCGVQVAQRLRKAAPERSPGIDLSRHEMPVLNLPGRGVCLRRGWVPAMATRPGFLGGCACVRGVG
jgi:hypothetical protein